MDDDDEDNDHNDDDDDDDICSEPLVVEEVPAPHRYRPDNLNSLCAATG